MGCSPQMAFMTSNSNHVSNSEPWLAGLLDASFDSGSSVFKKFQHLPRAFLPWSMRWNRPDSELEPAAWKIDFDSVPHVHLASRPSLVAVYGDATRVTHFLCQSPAQDHTTPL